MPNALVKFYRQQTPDDPRSDDDLTLLYGDQYGRDSLGQYPDFVKEYDSLDMDRRMASAPSLAGEAATGLARGTRSMLATGANALALGFGTVGATDLEKFYLEAGKGQEAKAAESHGTVPSVSRIRNLSDLLQYFAGGAGEVAPSIGEAGVSMAIGGAIGSVAGPGGTAAGALAGVIERQAVKSLLKKGRTELTKKLIEEEGRAIATRTGANLATVVNSYGQSAGEIYGDLATNPNIDPDTARHAALLFGAAAAAPDSILPAMVVKRFFPGAAGEAGKKEANRFVSRLFQDAIKEVPIEAVTEGFQELVGIAADRYADPKKRDLPMGQADFERILNASALGSIGGGMGAVIGAVGGGSRKESNTKETKEEANQPPPPPNVQRSSSPGVDVAEEYAREVGLTPEQRVEMEAIAQREAAGEISLADQTIIANNPVAYALVKGGMAKAPAASPVTDASEETRSTGQSDRDLLGEVIRDHQEKLVAEFEAQHQADMDAQAQREADAVRVQAEQAAEAQRSAETRRRVYETMLQPEEEIFSEDRILGLGLEASNSNTPVPQQIADAPASFDAGQFIDLLDFEETSGVLGKAFTAGHELPNIDRVTADVLGRELVRGARGDTQEENSDKTRTKRATFFRNTQTGEVKLLGTYEHEQTTRVVNPDEASKRNLSLKDLVVKQNRDKVGQRLWEPVGSVRFKNAAKNIRMTFTEEEFQRIQAGSVDRNAQAQGKFDALASAVSLSAPEVASGAEALSAASTDGPVDLTKDEWATVLRLVGGKQGSDLVSAITEHTAELIPLARKLPGGIVELKRAIETQTDENVNTKVATAGPGGGTASNAGVATANGGVGGTVPREGSGARFRQPTFYSRVSRTVEQSQQAKASGAQWKAAIRNSKIGVNQGEFDLVGVADLEDGKTYTKAEVLEYLKANEVVVKDVTLGENLSGESQSRFDAIQSRYKDLTDEIFDNRRKREEGLITMEEGRDTARRLSSERSGLDDEMNALNKQRSETHFSSYQLPGAVEGSYREVLLTVPKSGRERTINFFVQHPNGMWSALDENGNEIGGFYRTKAEADNAGKQIGWTDGHSQYSSIANPVVRLRFNERVTQDGKRMLFLEEVQAPQKGQFEKMPALFQKNWREIAFKYALRYAAENGFDSLGWTTGTQQAERYSLSKQVSEEGIRWSENPDKSIQLYAQRADTRGVLVNKAVELREVEDYAGKDVARQISEAVNRGVTQGSITGEKLDLGGEGLKKLYDQDFRNVVNNLPAVKKAGQKVGTSVISNTSPPVIRNGNALAPANVHSLTITDAIRESVMAGQALFREPTVRPTERASTSEVKGRFQEALDSLRARGIDTRIFSDLLNGLAAEYGIYDNARQLIWVAVADAANPTRENLVTLLHEAGHAVWARLDARTRALLVSALGDLTAEGNRVNAELQAEELFVEMAAQRGADRDLARGAWASLVRLVKEISLKVLLRVQQALFGPEHSHPGIANAYFENRVSRFMAGDVMPSFIAELGGGQPSLSTQSQFHNFTWGGGWVPEFYNWETGQLEYPDVVPDGPAAAVWNLTHGGARFRLPSVRTGPEPLGGEDNPTLRAGIDIAANNEARTVLDNMVAVAKHAPEVVGDAAQKSVETIQAKLDAMVKLKIPPADANANLSTMPTEVFRREAAVKAISLLNGVRAKMNSKLTEAKENIERVNRTIQRKNLRLEELRERYENADELWRETVDDLNEQLAEFKRDLRDQTKGWFKAGRLAQSIRDISGAREDVIPAQYELVVEKLWKEIQAGPVKFMDRLMALAQLNLDWSWPVSILGSPKPLQRQTDSDLKSLIKEAALTNPLLEPFAADTDEGRALLALAVSFGKKNDHVMALMTARESKDKTAQAALNTALKAAATDTSADLKVARSLAAKAGPLAREAGRILEVYQRLRRQNRAEQAGLKADEQFVVDHATTMPVLLNGLTRLEKVIGARRGFELTHGSKLMVPRSAKATVKEVENSIVEYQMTSPEAATRAEVYGWMTRMKAWLDAQPAEEHGATWQTVSEELAKLEMAEADKMHVAMRTRAYDRVLQSLSDRVGSSGTPGGRNAQTRFNRFTALIARFTHENEVLGKKWAKSKGDAMSATGVKREEDFYRLLLDPALKFIESRRDLAGTSGGQATVLKLVRNEFLNNSDTRDLVGRPGGWEALEKCLVLNGEAASLWDKTRRAMGLSVKDDAIGLFRESIGEPLFTVPRGIDPRMEGVWYDMRGQWNGTATPKLNAEEVAQAYAADPAGFSKAMAARFTPDVWEKFVRPMTQRANRALFSAPALEDGTDPIAMVANVKSAFEIAHGNPVAFAEALYELEGGTTDKAAFVGETLLTFQQYYNGIETIFSERTKMAESGMDMGVSHALMDARISDDYPHEWLEPLRPDARTARQIVTHLAQHAAFGLDMKGLKGDLHAAESELRPLKETWESIREGVAKANPGMRAGKVLDLARKEAKSLGLSVVSLENSEKNLAKVQSAGSEFSAWLKSQGGGLMDTGALLDAIQTIAGLAVQGVKTALVDTTTMFNPLLTVGVNAAGLKQVGRNWASFANEAFGTIFQQVGIQLKSNAEAVQRRQRLGRGDTDHHLKLMEKIGAVMATETGLKRGTRMVRELLSTGFAYPGNGTGQFATFKPQAAFTQLGQWMNAAMVDGVWAGFDDLAGRAVEYLQKHPESVTDPEFRFDAKMLGYKPGILVNDAQAFEYLTASLGRYGMTLENVARAGLTDAAPLFTDDQYSRLSALAQNELSLESNVTNIPPALQNNATLRLAKPLLAWGVSRVEQLRKAFRAPNGEANWQGFQAGLKAMTVLLPLGLAYAWLMQKYDEDITGKKSDLRGFGEDNNLLAFIEQTARVGSLGMIGDVVNTVGNFASGGDMRGVSVDNRVLFMNSMLSFLTATGTWIRQGEFTYATVGRKFATALGGSGYLQYAQILNNLFSLDNVESRVTARINAGNYLRAAGRELNLDVRTGRGMASQPTPVKPFISEMVLSALANDYASFHLAWTAAVEVARDEHKPDPVDYVKRSFESYHPLRTIFQTSPSEAEYHRLLGVMDDRGRENVSDAVRFFNLYAGRLGGKAYEGRKLTTPRRARSLFDLGAARDFSVVGF